MQIVPDKSFASYRPLVLTAMQMPCPLASATKEAMPFSPYSPSAATVDTYFHPICFAISIIA